MQTLFPQEKQLLETIRRQNSELDGVLAKAIEKIYIHLPEQFVLQKYDEKLVEEFLRALMKQSQKLGLEQYFSIVTEDDTYHTIEKRCIAPGELQENILKSLGSYGLSRLIRDILEKMTSNPFKKEDIRNLVTLIKTRNKLRQNEEKFLSNAFRTYLQKQISLYS